MRNIALVGYFEPVDSNFNNVQGNMIRTDNEGSSIVLDSCIFSNTAGQVLRTEASAHAVKITNCIFTNLGALSTSNFGAGKGIDLRASSCDTLIVQNNTFTNYQDRVIRHYNFSNPLAGTGNIGYALIDHNTMYDGMGFHGLLSLGNVGSKIIITNNLFKDAFAAGEDSTDATRQAEWANTGEKYPNGNNRMMWIFSAPNDSTQWVISNNYYAVSDSGQAFFDAHTAEPITVGSPLSWHINSRLGADSVNAFTEIADPMLTNTQMLMTKLMRWYVSPAGGNKTKNTPCTCWDRTKDDMDRRVIKFWIDTLNASYSMASEAYTGAQKGYPAGDLNWFPDKHAQWLSGASNLPSISLSATSIDFGSVETGSAKTDSIQIMNSGAVTLSISAIASDNANFTFAPSTLDIPASGSAYLKITFTPSDTNSQSGTISLTHNAAGSPATITVSGKGKTTVGVNDVNNVPKIFALEQNYPNPFNPSTLISFSLEKAGFATLVVYNVLGQKVATLISENISAGWHEVNFNASKISSGMYIYRLESGNKIAIKKMLLLK